MENLVAIFLVSNHGIHLKNNSPLITVRRFIAQGVLQPFTPHLPVEYLPLEVAPAFNDFIIPHHLFENFFGCHGGYYHIIILYA